MRARVIPPSDYRTMPWRNGGGTTAEIASSPGTDGRFAWRLSLADVTASGPFSDYAGYERFIAVASGAGMRLTVADRDPVEITQASAPFRFSGSASTSCTLISGAIRDFNLIFDPALVDARAARIRSGRASFMATGGMTFIYALEGAAVAHDALGEVALPPGSTVHISGVTGPLSFAPPAGGTGLAVELTQANPLPDVSRGVQNEPLP